jgi:lipoprotein-anchoring transpeptidase ErfK/SrfK
MPNRRTVILTGLAASALSAATARAQSRQGYTIPVEHLPVEVRLKGKYAQGEIHVDPNSFRLYWTLPNGKAIRYVVGVGRDNLYEAGEFRVGAKKEWPSWTPTKDMIKRDPGSYAQYADGMPGGPTNPLGARALYLFYPGRGDSFLRIHGTPQPWTVARAVSNGCARLVNAHIIDLYNRVPIGTRVVLHPKVAQTA